MSEKELEKVGRIAHYYTKIGVAVVELEASLSAGDKIAVKGSTTDFEQTVESMQIEHENIQTAKAGNSIGLKVKERVREDDVVYKVL
ncbi:MAG: translation elongation factor-like protein [Thermoproteota archaeon]|nr:translation elongation factor-like protein [Thermoproteota archaeon]